LGATNALAAIMQRYGVCFDGVLDFWSPDTDADAPVPLL
jgi:hypothetical protein